MRSGLDHPAYHRGVVACQVSDGTCGVRSGPLVKGTSSRRRTPGVASAEECLQAARPIER